MLMKTKTIEIKKFERHPNGIVIKDEDIQRINNKIRKEVEENEQRNWEGLQAIKNIRVKGTEKDREL